jgi:hypothetical protein
MNDCVLISRKVFDNTLLDPGLNFFASFVDSGSIFLPPIFICIKLFQQEDAEKIWNIFQLRVNVVHSKIVLLSCRNRLYPLPEVHFRNAFL